jgi:hypothetical protein
MDFKMSEKDKRQLMEETRDPRTILVCCGLHRYYGPSMIVDTRPVPGCKQCWMVWWLHEILKFPPSQRAEAIDQAFEAVAKCNEAVENGTWNFSPHLHPKITYEDDGN